MNFTFFSCANTLPIEHNSYFIAILIILLIFCVVLVCIQKRNIWIRSLAIMLGIWFGAGIFLHWQNPDNFISDWINSAVAIGTVGAVIISLYLSRLSNKTGLKNEAKKVMFLGLEILDTLSNYDMLIIEKMQGNDDKDERLNQKITEFQWSVELLFGDKNHSANKLVFDLIKFHKEAKKIAAEALKNYLKKKWIIVNNADTDFVMLYNNHRNSINNNNFIPVLNAAFGNLQSTFMEEKKKYTEQSFDLIKSL